MNKVYSINVRLPIDFLSKLIMNIDGDAIMSLEGDLSRCSFDDLEDCKTEPFPPLKKYISSSNKSYDYVAIPLNETNRRILIMSLLPRIGLRKHVAHIEIAQNDTKLFGSYDCFHPDCVWLDKDIGERLLQSMLNEKNILNYKLIESDI